VNKTQCNITKIAHELFIRFGFKAVTVDEIAKQAGISKKTLYENFEDKDKIVVAALTSIDEDMCRQESEIFNNSTNAIDEAIGHMVMLEKTLKTMNANCIPDLQKYYPIAFMGFKEHQQQQLESIAKNLKRGIKEGFYRKNIDIQFCAWYRMTTIFAMLQNAELAKRFDPIASQIEMMQHFLYGISTLKGHQLIEEHITKFKKRK
jgi:TetR/AcrR family transcriptional regulator, cholesterol catabolism regulator